MKFLYEFNSPCFFLFLFLYVCIFKMRPIWVTGWTVTSLLALKVHHIYTVADIWSWKSYVSQPNFINISGVKRLVSHPQIYSHINSRMARPQIRRIHCVYRWCCNSFWTFIMHGSIPVDQVQAIIALLRIFLFPYTIALLDAVDFSTD